jgi:hypothetical protein
MHLHFVRFQICELISVDVFLQELNADSLDFFIVPIQIAEEQSLLDYDFVAYSSKVVIDILHSFENSLEEGILLRDVFTIDALTVLLEGLTVLNSNRKHILGRHDKTTSKWPYLKLAYLS